MCRKQTRLWTAIPDRSPGQQVAICEECAATSDPMDVPSKSDWVARERRAWGGEVIPTEPEPSEMTCWSASRCCVCRTPTRLWTVLPERTADEQVAICQSCAVVTVPHDVPSKAAWQRNETKHAAWGPML